MSIERLSEDDMNAFDEEPEIAMDIHVGRKNSHYVLVVSGRTVIEYGDSLMGSLSAYNERMAAGRSDAGASQVAAWWNNLPISEPVTPVPGPEAFAALRFIHLGPVGALPSPPWRPPGVYGHLPFHGLCGGAEFFYRFESYPTSRRIDVKAGKVLLPGTYGCPELELQFIASGLAAVARFALPSLLPARWGYKLCPPAGTPMQYGASVPLYGQSGGGVEIFFPGTFINAGPIKTLPTLAIF